MKECVLGMIMFAGMSHEAWETLNGAFASISISQSSVIRQQMAELKKENKTITVYFRLFSSDEGTLGFSYHHRDASSR
jgi:hypothetical protein